MSSEATIAYFSIEVNARLARLAKAGGNLLEETAKKGDEVAAIGENQGIHFVIYPDGSMDRFEKLTFVKFRPGWTGPAINDEESLAKYRNEQNRAALVAATEAKEAKRKARQKKKDPNADASDAVRKQRYDIKIPDNFVDITDAMRPAFDFFFEKFGPLINKKIGTSIRETENWNDPEYVLDAVVDRMYEYLGKPDATGSVDGDGPEMTPEEYQEFKELDRKYQLAVAYQYCGMLPF